MSEDSFKTDMPDAMKADLLVRLRELFSSPVLNEKDKERLLLEVSKVLFFETVQNPK